MMGFLFTDRAGLLSGGLETEVWCRLEPKRALAARGGDAAEGEERGGRAFLPGGLSVQLGDELVHRGLRWRINELKNREMLGVSYWEVGLS